MTTLEKNDLTIDEVIDSAENDIKRTDITAEEMINAFKTIDEMEKIKWQKVISDIEEKYNAELIYKLVYKAMVDKINQVRQYRDNEYKQNDELRAKGISFAERMKQFNQAKVDWCNKIEAKLTSDIEVFRVRPLEQWLDRYDLDMAKRRGKGLGFIIGINLERCYFVPQE